MRNKRKALVNIGVSVIALGVCVYSALSDDSLFTPIFVNGLMRGQSSLFP